MVIIAFKKGISFRHFIQENGIKLFFHVPDFNILKVTRLQILTKNYSLQKLKKSKPIN